MKCFRLRSGSDVRFKTIDVLSQVLQMAPGGVNVADMRKRIRLLDVLEAARESSKVSLEDADHQFLVQIVEGFQFALADRELLAVLNDVTAAGPPEAEKS